MILLDTNVLSELMRPRPDGAVLAWIDSHDPEELWSCTVVAAEVLSGLDLMPDGRRQEELRAKAEHMFSTLFADRIYDFDLRGARALGTIMKTRKRIGRPMDEMDALIAATAHVNGAQLATRNTSDFEHCGVVLIDPWSS